MQTFELAVLALCTLYLIAGIGSGYQKIKIIRYVPAIIALVVIVHLGVEGYRWQMIPAYILTGALLVHSFRPGGPTRKGQWAAFLGWSMAVILLCLAGFLAHALPVPDFDKAGGEYPVGVETLHMQDFQRGEFITPDTSDHREFMVRLFYPAEEITATKADYIPNFKKVSFAFEAKMDWPSFLMDYLRLWKIPAYENAVPESGPAFPLVIYSHGLNNNFTEASARMANLAGRGYVVAAMNHTYGSDFTLFPDGRVKTFVALSQFGDPLDLIDSTRTRRVMQWMEDIKFTIEEIKDTSYGPIIDFGNIGLIGFSNGGSTATLSGSRIENVKLTVNMDGTPRGSIGEKITDTRYLFMKSEREHFSDAQLQQWGISRETVEAPLDLKEDRMNHILREQGGTLIHIAGTRHSNFTEYPLVSPFSSSLGIGGSIDSWECYEIINTILINYLDATLKSGKLEEISYPEIEITSYPILDR